LIKSWVINLWLDFFFCYNSGSEIHPYFETNTTNYNCPKYKYPHIKKFFFLLNFSIFFLNLIILIPIIQFSSTSSSEVIILNLRHLLIMLNQTLFKILFLLNLWFLKWFLNSFMSDRFQFIWIWTISTYIAEIIETLIYLIISCLASYSTALWILLHLFSFLILILYILWRTMWTTILIS